MFSLTDHREAGGARGPAASVLRHAGPISLILDGDRSHVDAVEVPLVDERESRTRVHRLGVSVPSDLECNNNDDALKDLSREARADVGKLSNSGSEG